MFRSQNSVERWSLVMRLLALLSIAGTILSIAAVLSGFGFRIVIDTEAGPRIFGVTDFSFGQRAVLVALVSLESMCWLWMLIQVVLMSYEFSSGRLISNGVVNGLGRFGLGLFGLALAEIVTPILVTTYLQWLHDSEPLESSAWLYLGSGVCESLMAGTLVVILSIIVKQSLHMKEELELTV